MFDMVNNTIIFHAAEQIEAARHCKNLHIDSTGGIVNNLQPMKPMLLMNMVMYDDSTDQMLRCLPVSNCLSQSQTGMEIHSFLNTVRKSYKMHHNTEFVPETITCDFSFAILHSISRSFHDLKLIDYLNNKFMKTLKDGPVIKLCRAHIFQAIARYISSIGVNKKNKKLMMLCLNSFMASKTTHERDEKWSAICSIFTGNNFEKSYEVLFENETCSDTSIMEEYIQDSYLNNMEYDDEIDDESTLLDSEDEKEIQIASSKKKRYLSEYN